MRIAVDLDGVLADTMVSVCQILNSSRTTPLAVESFVLWRAWEIAGITTDEFFRALDEAWFSWETLPPTEEELGAKVGRLRRFGSVDIVTGRSLASVPQANSWLKHQNPLRLIRSNRRQHQQNSIFTTTCASMTLQN